MVKLVVISETDKGKTIVRIEEGKEPEMFFAPAANIASVNHLDEVRPAIWIKKKEPLGKVIRASREMIFRGVEPGQKQSSIKEETKEDIENQGCHSKMCTIM